MKKITILGSTGSIGKSSLSVVDSYPDKLKVVALACEKNQELLASQVEKYAPEAVCIAEEPKEFLVNTCNIHHCEILRGKKGLINLATMPGSDLLLAGMSGVDGLVPVTEAIKAKKTIALANKETLVMAGEYVTSLAKEHGVDILPVDSEHNAIFQCLSGEKHESISRIILCASGGPFLDRPASEFGSITLAEALNHPRWKMGRKITIDSATMMNKGLELIEAKWLFDLPPEKVSVVIHPQSIAHSMVEFVDGSIIAQLGKTDMTMPIQYCLSYPERWPNRAQILDLPGAENLIFREPDSEKFPALNMAKVAMEEGGTLAAALNAADEEAVFAFMNKRISFTSIMDVVKSVMDSHKNSEATTLEEIIEVDRISRKKACDIIENIEQMI